MSNLAYHIPVMLHQSIEGLQIKPDGTYVDLTFGGGGHAGEILKWLDTGKLIAFDQDADAHKNVKPDKKLIMVKHNFKFLNNFLRYHQIDEVDGILADLGVSSHHFDNADRGFSFRHASELDMRMNRKAGFSAKELLNSFSVEQLVAIFKNYGELKNAGRIARAIVKARQQKELNETADLEAVLGEIAPKGYENKFYAQVYQSIRIEVNGEMQALRAMLLQTITALKPGGRLVVITYHSLEDRLVKNFMKFGQLEGEPHKDSFGNLQVPFKLITRKVITPHTEELKQNTRSRSAKLRIAEKL